MYSGSGNTMAHVDGYIPSLQYRYSFTKFPCTLTRDSIYGRRGAYVHDNGGSTTIPSRSERVKRGLSKTTREG